MPVTMQETYGGRTLADWTAIQTGTYDQIYKDCRPFGSQTLSFTVEQALWFDDYAYKPGRRADRGDQTRLFLKRLPLDELEGKRVLEIGCGFGQYAVLCAKVGAHVTGVELSPVGIARAREIAQANGVANRCRFIAGDFMTQGLPAEFFDVVFMNYVFQNMIKHPGVKDEIARVTKPGGRIVIADTIRGGALVNAGRGLVKALRYRGRPGAKEWDESKGGVPLTLADLEEFARGFSRHRLDLMNYVYMIKQVDYLKSRRRKLPVRMLLRAARAADIVLLNALPFLRKQCSEAVLCVEK